jgi:hypothetical protein
MSGLALVERREEVEGGLAIARDCQYRADLVAIPDGREVEKAIERPNRAVFNSIDGALEPAGVAGRRIATAASGMGNCWQDVLQRGEAMARDTSRGRRW